MAIDSDWILPLPFNLPTTLDPTVSAAAEYAIRLPLPFSLPAIPVVSQMAFATQPGYAGATQPFLQQPVITLRTAGGTTVTRDSSTTISIIIKPGTGTPGAVLSGAAPVIAVSGVVTFPNLAIDTMGTGYVLVASAPGLPTIESAPFTVGPARLLWDFITGFTPDVAAPFSGTRTPAFGSAWTVTDAATSGGKALQTVQGRGRIAQLGNQYAQTVAGWGKIALTGPAIARQQGRAFVVLMNVEDEASDFALHLATSATVGDPRSAGTGGEGFVMQLGGMEALVSGRLTQITTPKNTIRPNQYIFVIVLQSTGCYIFASLYKADPGLSGNMPDPVGFPAFPQMRFVYAGGISTAATLYPSLHFEHLFNYDYGHSVEGVQVFDITSDAAWTTYNGLATAWANFVAANGTSLTALPLNSGGTWHADTGSATIQSNSAQLAATSRVWTAATINGIFQDTITFSAASAQENRLIFRRSGTSDYMYLRCVQGATFVFGKVVGGTNTIIFQGGPNIFTKGAGASYDVAVLMQGNRYTILLDGVARQTWYVDTSNANLTGTGVGFDSTAQGGGTVSHTNFAFYPFTVAAPLEVQLCDAAPAALTAGAVLVQDSLNVAAGVSLSAHTPTIGPAWIEQHGSWIGDGAGHVNAAVSSSDGFVDLMALQDMGVIDVEYSVDIVMNSSLGAWVFGGIVGRYIDDNNYFVCREADDVADQPNDHELELHMVIAGFANVMHKTQFGIAYPAGSTHTLTIQFKGQMVYIFFDGDPRESFVLPDVLCGPTATKFGIVRNYPDTAVKGFSNVLVKSLAAPGLTAIPGSMSFIDLDPGHISSNPSTLTYTD